MRLFSAFAALLLVSCGSPETLRVRQFHLQSTDPADGHPFIRAEMNRRLYGAVTLEERTLRRGNYYHVRWRGLGGEKPVRVVLEYRQARTGARVRTKEKVMKANRRGDCEIVVAGREYLQDGHVQSWRVRLYDGGKLVAKKQSFLWE